MATDTAFMAYCGVIQWTQAVVDQAKLVQQREAALRELFTHSSMSAIQALGENSRLKLITAIHTADHFFLISCHQMLEYIKWAKGEGCYSEIDFSVIEAFAPAVRELRNMREHVIEYFKGKGHCSDRWVENGSDASSRSASLIGGRLDYVAVTAAAVQLLTQLDKTSLPTVSP